MPTPGTGIEIIDLPETETHNAAALIGHAFFLDPIWQYVVPEEERRSSLLSNLAIGWIKHARLSGYVWTTLDRHGVSLRRKPGHYVISYQDAVATGLAFERAKLGEKAFLRLTDCWRELQKHHEKFASAQSLYLWLSAVDLNYRGLGLAGH